MFILTLIGFFLFTQIIFVSSRLDKYDSISLLDGFILGQLLIGFIALLALRDLRK